ncbi:universal stress protein [Pontibacter sp. E15-1]|uniref:universal stress protein n=1 Tax=Pontibacter sp. E15-1 TaxID=2919918 RepID=UPI001F4F1FAA|nr:universal stress protein [Pontibacter sp. E15-1]MCJ8163651.1 universal stress protein [Pontibacter sp. E15-1]
MITLNRLLVGLDLTPADDTLIEYTAYLCAELQVNYVCFIHVEKKLEVPVELLPNLRRETLTPEESFRQMIAAKVQTVFARLPQVEVEVQIDEGSPLKQLLHWTNVKQIDLILAGRKLRLHGSGVLAQKLLRSGRNSVLFVPEAFEPRLRRIVVSVDFSKYSEMALDRVLHSALSKPDVQVVCLHVYEVPPGYITLGMSYEEFDDRMRGFAREKYEKLLGRFPELEERAEFVLVRKNEQDDVGALVVMEAKRAHADMLVIGAKGMSAAALFVIGSVTEKILRHDMDIPLLVFKNKDETIGFLDAIIG